MPGRWGLVAKRGLCSVAAPALLRSVAAAALLCLLLGCLGGLLGLLLLCRSRRLGCRSCGCCGRRDCSCHWVRRHGNHRRCSLQRSSIGGSRCSIGGWSCVGSRCRIGDWCCYCFDRSCYCFDRSCVGDWCCSIADRVPTSCNEGHIFKSVWLLEVLLWL